MCVCELDSVCALPRSSVKITLLAYAVQLFAPFAGVGQHFILCLCCLCCHPSLARLARFLLPLPRPHSGSPSWPRYACYCGSCCCRLVTSKSLPDPVRPRPGLPIVCFALFCCSLARFSAVRKMWAAAKESKKKQNSKSRANRSCNPLPQNADGKQLKQAELPRVAECTAQPLKRERAKWDKDEQSARCDARGVEKRRGARGRMHCGALIVAISR